MCLSRAFGKTLRESPADAEMISHQLLVRANFVRLAGAGIYTFMPLGFRVLRKIWRIMFEEMDAICGSRIEARRAIEAGHCFKLGTRYSEAVNATYLDENGRPQLIFMGSYGIGLDRLMAIIVELHHDKDGIIWPESIAPYQVHLLHLGKGDDLRQVAENLYSELGEAGLEVLYDDRELSAGVKFKDADLIGIPWRVTVGARSLAQGAVEVKRRDDPVRHLVPLPDLQAFLMP